MHKFTIPELVRLWEHDKDMALEVVHNVSGDNPVILIDIIKDCLVEISIKNQQIEYAKRDLREAYDAISKIGN